MSKIRIISKGGWLLSFYDMKVYLDGQLAGYMPLGDEKDFEVSAGEHNLKVKLGFYGSKEISFTIFNKDLRSFSISVNRAGLFPIIIFILSVLATQILAPESFKATELFSGVMSAIVVIFAGYFLLFGRSSFLRITESGKD